LTIYNCRMMELNKVYKFTYHYNCCCHIVIKEKIHVNIKTNNKICVTLYDLVSQQKFWEMSSDCISSLFLTYAMPSGSILKRSFGLLNKVILISEYNYKKYTRE